MERLNQAGIKRLGAIHRGFSSFEQKIYRNAPMWQIPIELHRRIPDSSSRAIATPTRHGAMPSSR